MARHIELKGKAKTYVGFAGLLVAGWLILGQTFFTFDLGFFHRGYQASFLRSGHFESRGIRWDQHSRSLGRIVSPGGEELVIDLGAEIKRGTLVVFAWRWPAFWFDEPMVHRTRFDDDATTRLRADLPGPGLYTLSVTAVNLRGDIQVDWAIQRPGADLE